MSEPNEELEMAWLYHLPPFDENEPIENNFEEEAYNPEQEGIENNFEEEAWHPEQEGGGSDNESYESFSQIPPRLNVVDLIETNENSGNILFYPKMECTSNLISEDESVIKNCSLCLETHLETKFVYFKDRWMVGQKCCNNNSICGECVLNMLKYNTTLVLLCPFCRTPVSHIETYDSDLTEKILENVNFK